MLVPHGSEALQSWSVSERSVRGAVWGAGVLAIILLVGVVSISVQLRRMMSQPAMAATPTGQREKGAGEVEALRDRVDALNQTLDTIRSAEARFRASAGPVAERPTGDSVARLISARAESLQARAAAVAKGYGTLADSTVRAAARRSPSARRQ